MQTVEMVVAGGGLVGAALACAMAKNGFEVTLLEAGREENFLDDKFDGRVSAISYASYLILKDCGVWERLNGKAEPILKVLAADDNSPFFVNFDHHDFSDKPLGYMVENRHMRAALYEAVKSYSAITMKTQSAVVDVQNFPETVVVKTSNGEEYASPILFAVDGRKSQIRKNVGIEHTEIAYNQTAIVCVIQHEKTHNGVAVEKFFPAGPFAILPMMNNQSGIVWTESTKFAPDYMALSDVDFLAEISKRAGNYLGEITLQKGRWSYPLSLSLAKDYFKGRVVLVGDSAHGIHPIAGQGANVGFRDVAALVELMANQRKLGLDIASFGLLEQYQRWRRFDAVSMAAVTDVINRLFMSKTPGVKAARNIGMGAVNKIPFARKFLMRHAMGVVGKLPKVISGGL